MFLNIPSSVPYIDPWLSSYDTRLKQMMAQPRRIAYFYELPDTSTFRYRAFNPGVTLSANPELAASAAWFDHRDLDSDPGFIEMASALVICRTRYNARVAQLIARARVRGIPVLFDCDDLVFDIDRLHLLIDSLNQNQSDEAVWNYWFSMIGRLGATMRLCDAFITTNDYLAERAKEFEPRLRTVVVPNYLNREQQDLSVKFHDIKRKANWARDGRIHIGYFSGSPSHARDFAVAAPAICRLLESDPRIVLRVVGFLDINQELNRYRDRIEVYPLQDFLNLQRLIAEVEINIAPLQLNTFTNCKSEIKYFEAGICGTLTLATPTFAFRNSIKHARTGFLVKPHEWDSALQEALAIVENPGRYSTIVEAASEHAQLTYGWNRPTDNIIQAVFSRP